MSGPTYLSRVDVGLGREPLPHKCTRFKALDLVDALAKILKCVVDWVGRSEVGIMGTLNPPLPYIYHPPRNSISFTEPFLDVQPLQAKELVSLGLLDDVMLRSLLQRHDARHDLRTTANPTDSNLGSL